jgi:hypothetical protein
MTKSTKTQISNGVKLGVIIGTLGTLLAVIKMLLQYC